MVLKRFVRYKLWRMEVPVLILYNIFKRYRRTTVLYHMTNTVVSAICFCRRRNDEPQTDVRVQESRPRQVPEQIVPRETSRERVEEHFGRYLRSVFAARP